ncbi:Uma2 family endonuclease [Tolypothrix sp. PCC 7910]|uniref:Uma2 family endonuclease n=1 Tax=Tolypothrix sp. PCC 7910 TaxID=2099387 RepID=UPI001427729F|nr:Uma2 family endonuclease [Tolypothrix sp. PCC 7910]QIR37435.1 Uma2 family endonuclease [Tolypothrix sp. PCC 7910]
MNQQTTERVRWKTADLELFPDNGNRYEIIDGELLVTSAPHWKHQKTCVRISGVFDNWSQVSGLGEVVTDPGIIFGDNDHVIPDVVWASNEKLATVLDEAGHLTAAPELVVEVLSAEIENEKRDRELKLKLYSSRGVREYWIVDWRKQQIEVYRREQGILKLAATLFHDDELTSPILPDFTCAIALLFK